MSDALFVKSVDALVACTDLRELASSVARVAQRSLLADDVLVTLRSSEGDFVGTPSDDGGEHGNGSAGNGSGELQGWAHQLLASGVPAGVQVDGRRLAAHFGATGLELQGLLLVSLPEGGDSSEASSLLAALTDLTSTCSAQLVRRAHADRALRDTHALMARGLHDLCTPLNSLRLGMHLLEPALTTKDPVVAQRAHRAVDRMATLVTNLAEALGPTPPQRAERAQ